MERFVIGMVLNGTEWRVMGDTSSFDSYTKQEVNNLLNRYVTNDTFNNFKEEINQTITPVAGTTYNIVDE